MVNGNEHARQEIPLTDRPQAEQTLHPCLSSGVQKSQCNDAAAI